MSIVEHSGLSETMRPEGNSHPHTGGSGVSDDGAYAHASGAHNPMPFYIGSGPASG